MLETKIFRLSEGNHGTRRPDPAKAPKTKLTQKNVATLFGLHALTVSLKKRAFGGLLFLLVVMAALLFLPAWTFNYWQAWIFLAVFGASALSITVYLMKKDPKLLGRRVQVGPIAEKETGQKVIQSITASGFVAMIALSAFDHRFTWSTVPLFAVAAGDVLVAAGFLTVFLVFKENSFASATIELDSEQKVISTGLYALVRHPMYLGAFVLLFGVPVSLGSWWGLSGTIVAILGVVWRIFDEEQFLAKNLPGYSDYQNKVLYRMIPYVW